MIAGAVWTPQGTTPTSFQQQPTQAGHANPATPARGAAQAAPVVPQPQAVQAQPTAATAAANPGLPQLPPLLPQGSVFRADGARGLPLPQQLPVPQGAGPHGPSFLQLLSMPLNPANLGLPPLEASAPVLVPSSSTPAPATAGRAKTAHESKDGEPCATAEPLTPGVQALVNAVHSGEMGRAADLLALLHPPAAPPMGPASGEAPATEPSTPELPTTTADASYAHAPSEDMSADAALASGAPASDAEGGHAPILQLPQVAEGGMLENNVAFFDSSTADNGMVNTAAEEAVPEGAAVTAEGESAPSMLASGLEEGTTRNLLRAHGGWGRRRCWDGVRGWVMKI